MQESREVHCDEDEHAKSFVCMGFVSAEAHTIRHYLGIPVVFQSFKPVPVDSNVLLLLVALSNAPWAAASMYVIGCLDLPYKPTCPPLLGLRAGQFLITLHSAIRILSIPKTTHLGDLPKFPATNPDTQTFD